jgi:hypothetical protein
MVELATQPTTPRYAAVMAEGVEGTVSEQLEELRTQLVWVKEYL